MPNKNIKITDGVTVEAYNLDPEEQAEHDEIIRNEAIRQEKLESEKDSRIQSILSTVREQLGKGLFVDITDEMEELGLKDQIVSMRFEAQMTYNLFSKLNNTSRAPDPEFSMPGSDFFGEDKPIF